MKILFLTYHGFDPASGISKKMLAQIKGLRQNGHEVHICSYGYNNQGHLCRFADDIVLKDYGRGLKAAVLQRLDYGCIIDYCMQQDIELVYARSYMNATYPLVRLFKRIRQLGIHRIMEIPTYPYDQEFRGYDWNQRLRLFVDKIYRRQLAEQMDAIVTFSDEKTIFGQQTICISNGVDMETIPLLNSRPDISREIHVIAVAEVHSWHGFDRFIHGMGEYYKKNKGKSFRNIYFHIVGDVWKSEMEGSKLAPGYASYIREYDIGEFVIFHGKLFGEKLNEVFNVCSFGVGSLARHRSGIVAIKTLKNREYACRGIPFVYSEQDSDFDSQPYVLKVPANEEPVNMDDVISLLDSLTMSPQEIRDSIRHLSWKIQMQKVIEQLLNVV